MFSDSLRKAVAQMVMPRVDGPRLEDDGYRAHIGQLVDACIGGFILFGGSVRDTPRRLAELQERAPVPLLISSDVERGLGQQLAGGTRFPNQRAVAAALAERTKKDGELLNAMLDAVRIESRAAGIHLVFSPVMDVNSNPDNPIICTRAFGSDPRTVERLGGAYIRGLQQARRGGHLDLLACAKHFPGHGDTAQDSHMVLPVIRADRSRLNSLELPPFREAVKAGVGTVMVGHLLVPALDPLKPVTFSKKAVTALLREGMEFEGLIVSDALDMGALAEEYSPEDIAVRAVEAGMDVLLHPVDALRTVEAVAKAVEHGTLTEQRIRESAGRIREAKEKLGLLEQTTPAARKINYAKHRQIAAMIAKKALTLVRGSRKQLPLDAGKSVACYILDDDGEGMGGPFRNALAASFGEVRTTTLTPDVCGDGLAAHLDPGPAAAAVIGIFSKVKASKGRSGIDPGLRQAAQEVLRRTKAGKIPGIVISFDSPYILEQFTDADILIAGYDRMEAVQAAAAGMLGGRRRRR